MKLKQREVNNAIVELIVPENPLEDEVCKTLLTVFVQQHLKTEVEKFAGFVALAYGKNGIEIAFLQEEDPE